MKAIKKSICIILAFVSILALNACGGETTPNSNETTTAPLSASFDFDKKRVRINKSFQCLHGKEVITSPKTLKSNRP